MSANCYNLEYERGDPFNLKSQEIIKKENGSNVIPKKKKRINKSNK